MITPPLLLGIADRVNPRGTMSVAVPMDILGLRQVVISHIFPLDLRNYQFLIGFPPGSPTKGRLQISMAERPGEEIWAEYKLDTGNDADPGPGTMERQMVIAFPLRGNIVQSTVWQPGRLQVQLDLGEEKYQLGFIEFAYVPAPPLSEDVRRAIESNPGLWGALRFEIKCSKCGEGITPFVALKRPSPGRPKPPGPAPTWYQDLPDEFHCSCGTFKIPLRYLRESMHALLSATNSLHPDGSLRTEETPLSTAEVERVLRAFVDLLDEEPDEGEIQAFIQENTMLLAPFAARQLFFKPKIVNKYAADFGIVTPRGDLLLIEIERPALKLMKSDGTQGHELTHAFSQPQSWHHEITENRAAVLRGIPNCPDDIGTIKYLVIAGRSKDYNLEDLTRLLRGTLFCELMTYDHLVEGVRNSVRQATG
jgi:hypothetical protein